MIFNFSVQPDPKSVDLKSDVMLVHSRCWPRRVVAHWRRWNSSSSTLRASSVTDASRRMRKNTSSWYVHTASIMYCDSWYVQAIRVGGLP